MLEHLTELMGWTSRLTFIAGRSKSTETQADGSTLDVDIKNQMGGAWSMTYDWFTARIAYFESRLNIPVEGTAALADLIEAYDAGLALASVPDYSAGSLDKYADAVEFNEDKASFTGIGFAVDKGNLIAAAEYTMIRIDDSPLEDRDAWYVSAGYRMQKFTPFFTYEKWNFNSQDTTEEFAAAAPITGFPSPGPGIPSFDEIRSGIIGGMTQVFTGDKDAETIGVGVRYDFHPSAAIKVEYNQQDNSTDDVKPKVLAAAVQLVF